MFELRDLFGGAICAHLPENAVDIRFFVVEILQFCCFLNSKHF